MLEFNMFIKSIVNDSFESIFATKIKHQVSLVFAKFVLNYIKTKTLEETAMK